MIPPLQEVMVPVRDDTNYDLTNGTLEATSAFERKDALLVSPALFILTEGKTMLHVTNAHLQTKTLDRCITVAKFKVINPQQVANTKPVPHAQVLLMHNPVYDNIFSHLFDEETKHDIRRW